MVYIPTTFVNGQAPAVSAEELNKLGNGIRDAYNPVNKPVSVGSMSFTVTVTADDTDYSYSAPIGDKRFFWVAAGSGGVFFDRLNPNHKVWFNTALYNGEGLYQMQMANRGSVELTQADSYEYVAFVNISISNGVATVTFRNSIDAGLLPKTYSYTFNYISW